MGYPEYPEHGFIEDTHFGAYLHPGSDDGQWGVVTTGGGTFRTNEQLIPSNGRVLDDFGLVMVSSGSGTFRGADQEEREVRNGDLIVLLPGEWHHYAPDSTEGWVETWILFRGFVPETLRERGQALGSQRVVSLARPAEWRHLLSDIVNILTLHEEIAGGIQARLAVRILPLLLRLHRVELATDQPAGDAKIETVLRYLEERSPGSTDWDELARKVELSVGQLRRRFKNYTGSSPHQYLLDLRIKQAKELLLRSSVPIDEIAHRLGYGSSTQFTRIFKSRTGVTPSLWRAEHVAVGW